MRPPRLILLAVLFVIGISVIFVLACPKQRATRLSPASRVEFDYAFIKIVSKPGTTVDLMPTMSREFPKYLKDVHDKSIFPVGSQVGVDLHWSSADDLLAQLRQHEPGYDFVALWSGKVRFDPTGSGVIRGGPSKDDPAQQEIEESIAVSPASGEWVNIVRHSQSTMLIDGKLVRSPRNGPFKFRLRIGYSYRCGTWNIPGGVTELLIHPHMVSSGNK